MSMTEVEKWQVRLNWLNDMHEVLGAGSLPAVRTRINGKLQEVTEKLNAAKQAAEIDRRIIPEDRTK